MRRLTPFVFGLCVVGCGSPPPIAPGRWIGDLVDSSGATPLELTIDSTGGGTISARALGLEAARAVRAADRADSIALTIVADTDTVTLIGAASAGRLSGRVRRNAEDRAVELRLTVPFEDQDWRRLFGAYRAADGHLLGIAPFEEFGPVPQLVDYTTGRIGALIPVGPDLLLIGKSLVSPRFPADTLEVQRAADGTVTDIVVHGTDWPTPVAATRIATTEEEFSFRNGDVTLQGTLTMPKGPGPHPAVVLVHGSGPLTRRHIGIWAPFFASQGFAVLGFDKRGTGASTGDWQQVGFGPLADDVVAAVRALAARSEIRRDRIGLWGISQAGWVMPLAASRAPDDIAFLIVHAGTGTTVREQGVLNLQHEYRFGGATEEQIATVTRYRMLDDSVTVTGRGFDRLERFYQEHGDAAALYPPSPADAPFRAYYRMLIDYDPAATWTRVTGPVLLFFGELDANVPPRESWPPIERGLRAARNTRVEHYILPKANHVLLAARTGAGSEYPGLSRFVPGYFDRMAAWLADRRD